MSNHCRPKHTAARLKLSFRRKVVKAWERGDRAALDELRTERGI